MEATNQYLKENPDSYKNIMLGMGRLGKFKVDELLKQALKEKMKIRFYYDSAIREVNYVFIKNNK
jgi:hypothetical protein